LVGLGWKVGPPLGGKILLVNNWTHIAIWAVVIAAVFGYLWWQGQVQRLAVYVQETREELKKCAWPTWEELKGSTALVVVMITALGAFIIIVDEILFKVFFR
jgi:preprotein translocase SecE subunit